MLKKPKKYNWLNKVMCFLADQKVAVLIAVIGLVVTIYLASTDKTEKILTDIYNVLVDDAHEKSKKERTLEETQAYPASIQKTTNRPSNGLEKEKNQITTNRPSDDEMCIRTGYVVYAFVNNKFDPSFSFKIGEMLQLKSISEKQKTTKFINASCFDQTFHQDMDCLLTQDFLKTIRYVITVKSTDEFKNDPSYRNWEYINSLYEIMMIDLEERSFNPSTIVKRNSGISKEHAREKAQADFLDSIKNVSFKIYN